MQQWKIPPNFRDPSCQVLLWIFNRQILRSFTKAKLLLQLLLKKGRINIMKRRSQIFMCHPQFARRSYWVIMTRLFLLFICRLNEVHRKWENFLMDMIFLIMYGRWKANKKNGMTEVKCIRPKFLLKVSVITGRSGSLGIKRWKIKWSMNRFRHPKF